MLSQSASLAITASCVGRLTYKFDVDLVAVLVFRSLLEAYTCIVDSYFFDDFLLNFFL
jgi:hypothetical protein